MYAIWFYYKNIWVQFVNALIDRGASSLSVWGRDGG